MGENTLITTTFKATSETGTATTQQRNISTRVGARAIKRPSNSAPTSGWRRAVRHLSPFL